MHRRKWTCPNRCGKDLRTKAGMIQHLLTEHSSIINERQVSTYANMCEREIDDTAIDVCLICSEKMSLSRLESHLATHMEEIALFVLPLTPDDDETDLIEEVAEDDSQNNSRTHDTGAAKDATEHAKWPEALRQATVSRSGESGASFDQETSDGHRTEAVSDNLESANDDFDADASNILPEQQIYESTKQSKEPVDIDDIKLKRSSSPETHSTTSQKLPERGRVPVFPRIHRKYLDVETLEHWELSWEWDRVSLFL